jgi:translation initiation factor 6
MPVFPASIGGLNIIGRMCAANSNGLILPNSCSDEEMEQIEMNMPKGVNVTRVDERLNALGNSILCNDFVAIIHPDMSLETEEAIKETLQVEVYRSTIARNPLVGSYASISNKGGIVHPMTTVQELSELQSLLQVPLCSGTVNRGSEDISNGLVCNDFTAFSGMETTAKELSLIDQILKIADN